MVPGTIKMVDELVRGPSGYSAVAHLPLIAEKEELVIIHFDTVAIGQSSYD